VGSWYILDDNNQVVPAVLRTSGLDGLQEMIGMDHSLLAYAEWMASGGDQRRQVALDVTEHHSVSTIFLGLDHRSIRSVGEPLVFETMTFRTTGGIVGQCRYTTYDDALAGHALELHRIKIAEARAASGVDRLKADAKPDSYTCPDCGAVSYHPKDIEHRYCGRCHQFEEFRNKNHGRLS
jgi:ribosomal protein S27AE